MISDAQVEAANDFIRDNAAKYAKAKAERVYLEHFRKSKQAILVLKVDGTIQERESYARAHPEYLKILDGLKIATEEEERIKWLLVAAQTKIETWRTEQANTRRGV